MKHILGEIYDVPWLIKESALANIADVVERKIKGESLSAAELEVLKEMSNGNFAAKKELELPETPSVAVLPIYGSLFPRANLMSEISGASSVEKLSSDFKQMIESDMVTSIVLDINSPGGKADMIAEFGDVIYEARGTKPIVAIANSDCCSAAYWLGTQADKLYATKSGELGSIGVMGVHRETSEANAKDGITYTVIKMGDFKAEGNPYEPLSDDAKNHILENMSEVYKDFIGVVARGRNVDEETVFNHFGKGRTYVPRTALQKGMIDGIKTLDAVISETQTQVQPQRTSIAVPVNVEKDRRKTMDGVTPKTLEVLGLSEDATDEEIEAAVVELSDTVAPIAGAVSDALEFEAQYPTQAAQLRELEKTNRINNAKLFAEDYKQFGNGMGLSSLALQQVEDFHMKISTKDFSLEDLKTFLDSVVDGTAVVEYGEIGSARGKEIADGTADTQSAANQLRAMALEAQKEAGGITELSFGDALSQVMADPTNIELVRAYRKRPIKRGE